MSGVGEGLDSATSAEHALPMVIHRLSLTHRYRWPSPGSLVSGRSLSHGCILGPALTRLRVPHRTSWRFQLGRKLSFRRRMLLCTGGAPRRTWWRRRRMWARRGGAHRLRL